MKPLIKYRGFNLTIEHVKTGDDDYYYGTIVGTNLRCVGDTKNELKDNFYNEVDTFLLDKEED